jgi:hypothetical protein
LFAAVLASLDAACCISLEFCSNVFAVLTPRLDRCLELSLACCKTDFHESKFENVMLFASLIADTALSAILLTNLLYTLAIDSGEFQVLTTLLYRSLYGLHADCRELIIDF